MFMLAQYKILGKDKDLPTILNICSSWVLINTPTKKYTANSFVNIPDLETLEQVELILIISLILIKNTFMKQWTCSPNSLSILNFHNPAWIGK